MSPKGKGGKSKAGEAPPSGCGGEAKAFQAQARSFTGGPQVCLVLASSVAAGLSTGRGRFGGVAPVNVVPRRPYPPITQTMHSEQYAYRR